MKIVKAYIKAEAEFLATVVLNADGEVEAIDNIIEVVEVDDGDVELRKIEEVLLDN